MSAGVGLRMRRFILFLWWSVASFSALASDPVTVYQVPPGAVSLTPLAACQSYAAGFPAEHPVVAVYIYSGAPDDGRCILDYESGRAASLEVMSFLGCPGGAAIVSGQCPGSCAAQAGQARTINVTSGWARSNSINASDITIDLMGTAAAITADRCDSGCTMQFVSVGNSYRSQQPFENGLHRVSQDLVMVQVDTPCTLASDALNNPAATPPSCPGIRGEVNGKPACFGTSGSPLPAHPPTDGTPPQTPGNPAAGSKPATGPGSGSDGTGRTPVTGNGGNAGGGSNASVPGGGSDGNGQGDGTPNGTGASGDPKPAKDPCGIPGSAPCKLDESGTPNGTGAFNGATSALDALGQSAIDGVNSAAGASGKETSWGFGFALPTACTPLEMAGYDLSLNVCRFQPVIHDLMSLVWIATALWLIIGMVGRAIGGGSS